MEENSLGAIIGLNKHCVGSIRTKKTFSWAKKIGPEHLSLKVPNVKFDFDVSVDSMQLQTDTSKSNFMLK